MDGILDLAGGQALRDVAPLATQPSTIVSAGDPATAQQVGGAAIERHPGTAVLAAVGALVAEGKLDPHVRQTFPLSEAGAALQAVEAGHARGKIVLTVG